MTNLEVYLKYKQHIYISRYNKLLYININKYIIYLNINNILYNNINNNIIYKYLLSLKESKYTIKYIYNNIQCLKAFYRYLIKENLIDKDIVIKAFQGIKIINLMKDEHNYLPLKELDTIIQYTTIKKRTINNPYQLKAFLYFLYYTGITKGEYEALKREDFDLEHNLVKIKDRIVFYPIKVKELILKYFNTIQIKKDVFNIGLTSDFFVALAKIYPQRKIGFELLRFSFINLMVHKHMDFYVMKYLLGYKRDSDLFRYYKPNLKTIEKMYHKRIK